MPNMNLRPVHEPGPRFTVRVTQHHIDTAMRCNGARCMVADAVIDAYPDGCYVQADVQSIRVTNLNKERRYFYFTPRHVQAKILAFDRGEIVKPFHFLLIDPQVRRSGWKADRSANASRRGKKYGKAKAPQQKTMPTRTYRRAFGQCALPENQTGQP